MLSCFVEGIVRKLYNAGQYKRTIKFGLFYLGFNKVFPEGKNPGNFFDQQILILICCAQSIIGNISDSLKTAELGLKCARQSDWTSQVVAFGEIVSNRKLILGKVLEAFEMNTNVLNIANNAYANAQKEGDELNAELIKLQFSPLYHNRSWTYEIARQLDKAEETARIALKWSTENFGDDTVSNSHNKMLLCRMLRHQGKLDEGEEILDKVMALREKELPADSIHVFDGWLSKGIFCLLRKDLKRAEEYILKAHKAAIEFDKKQGYPEFGFLKQWLGRLRLEQGKYQDAEKLFLASVEDYHRVYCVDHPTTIDLLEDIVRLYQETRDKKKVEEYATKLETIKSKLPVLD